MGCFRLQEQAHGAVHESILVTKSGASVGVVAAFRRP